MAHRLLRVCSTITNTLKDCHAINYVTTGGLLKPNVPLVQHAKNTSFFNKRPAEQLWKSVTSVSNAGRKRGRGRGATKIRNLNKGQVIGVGKVQIMFPGLNTPVFRGRELVEQQIISKTPSEKMQNEIIKLRDSMSVRKRMKLTPLERGWTGGHLGGRKLGPPDPIGEDTFEGFESWILECKPVSHMTGNLGSKKRYSAFVITGNGNGLAGFALRKAPDIKSAINAAKNRAACKLMYIERKDDHTVLHNFFSQFGKTKVYVKQMPHGYGLVCHRGIKACCEAIGIKDMYAKVEGSTNIQNVIKAFFLGLLNQKSYQKIADEKKLHLVELREECDYYPKILASPAVVRKSSEIPSSEILDFDQYILDGKVRYEKEKALPFYAKLPSWERHLRKQEHWRDQDNVRIQLKAEYGDIRSFLAEKYPECVKKITIKKIVAKYNNTEEAEA